MRRSLQNHLLLATTCITTVVLGLSGLVTYVLVRHALYSSFDASLLVQARSLSTMAEQDGGEVHVEYEPQEVPEFLPGRRPEYFQMWRADGSVLLRSPSLGQRDLGANPSKAAVVMWSVILPNGRHGRAVQIRFNPKSDRENPASLPAARVGLVVARDAGELRETLERLRWLLLGVCVAAIVLCDGMLILVVRASVRPVRKLSQEIELIGGRDLDRRLKTEGLPAELLPVVEKLNGLLERISEAFGRERAFAADAAHELRTPLAGLQATLEVCRSRPRDREAYEAAIGKCLAMITPMQQMVEQLLMLARAESGQLSITLRPLDLSELACDCWAEFEERAGQRGLRINLDVPPGCQIQGDRDKLCIVLRNLFENAVTYVDTGGTIDIAVHEQEAYVTLIVSNTGSHVRTEDAARVFERFWQGDTARASTGQHSGLGLSLCDRLIALLRGRIEVQTQAAGRFSVMVRVPKTP